MPREWNLRIKEFDSMISYHKIMAYVMIFIVLSYSGCISKIEDGSINDRDLSNSFVVISSTEDLELIAESSQNAGFNQELVTLLESLENYDYYCNPEYDYEMAAETAYSISTEIQDHGLKPLNIELLKEYGSYKHEVNQANRVIDTLNGKMEYHFDKIPDDELSHNKFISLINSGQKYLPIVDSYNEFLNSSKYVIDDRNNQDNIRRFYICAFLLAVDVALIESGGMHKTTFKSVGTISRDLKLMKTVPYLGYSGYGLLLSTIYWSIRGYMEETKNEVFDVLRDGIPEEEIKIYVSQITAENITSCFDAVSETSMKKIDIVNNEVKKLGID
jgi:hypothetical protein